MLGSLGFPEILFILVIALLVFGPKRLPQVGRTLGKALGEFRRATTDLKQSIDREIHTDLTAPEPAKATNAPQGATVAREAAAPAVPEAGGSEADEAPDETPSDEAEKPN